MLYQKSEFSNQAYKTCKQCGRQILRQTKVCPHCYKKQMTIQEVIVRIVGACFTFAFLAAILTSFDDYDDEMNEDKVVQDSATKSEETSEVSNQFTYDDMDVVYLESKIEENAVGEECLVLYFDFTNNTDENKSFVYAFAVQAFQHGIELDDSLTHVNEKTKNRTKEIQPGNTVTVAKSFVLTEDRSVVEVEIEPWASFTDETLFEIEIALE